MLQNCLSKKEEVSKIESPELQIHSTSVDIHAGTLPPNCTTEDRLNHNWYDIEIWNMRTIIHFLLVISDLKSILLHFSIILDISEDSTPSSNHELNSNSCDENCQSYLEDPFPPSMCQSLMSEYKHVQGTEHFKSKYHRDKEASTPNQMKVWQNLLRPKNERIFTISNYYFML